MKRIISAALALTLFIGAAQAQPNDKGDRRQKGEIKEMPYQKLNLTADQKAQLKTLREAQKKEMQDLRNSSNMTPEQRKAIHEKYKAQYSALLTPAQREELSAKKGEWKSKAGKGNKAGKRRAGNMGAQAAYFKKELNLTNDQETKLSAMLQEFRTKSQDIRSNNNLSPEQKRTQTRTLAQQYMAQGRAILTPEQAKKFDDMKGKRRNSNL